MLNSLPTNEGYADRMVRVVIGLALIALTIVGPRTGWGYLGFVPLITAFIGFCPLYALFGISTCPAGQATRRAP